MKYSLFIILTIFISVSLYSAESVSIVNLISNPNQYHEKEVIIGGFLSLEEEGTAIYLSNSDRDYLFAKNGLWCNIDMVKYAKFHNNYVNIEGVFDSNNHGHMGLWSGSINDIKRVWFPPGRMKAAQQVDAPEPASPAR